MRHIVNTIYSRAQLRINTLLAVGRARKESLERAATLSFCKTLVLCYGNIYRSPLVAAHLQSGPLKSGHFEVRSAGFHPKPGRSAPPDFVELVRSCTGLDLSGHRSRVVTKEDLEWASAIVLMDRHNWHALSAIDSSRASLVIWLGAFLNSGSPEISDPYGLQESEIAAIAHDLVTASEHLERTAGHRRCATDT